MEAELFGYAKGAFSGATHRFDGQLMAAQGGTVFLDEIDDTPLSTQVKLLRVLEDRVVTRVGESEPHKVDFRILAATNRDLRPLIDSGAFGADFYERLAIVTIQLPPLRERLADLPSLAAFFIDRFKREEPDRRSEVTQISPRALTALLAYPWPGNIRELRNVLFGALVYKRAGDTLLLSDLPRRVLRRESAPSPSPAKTGTALFDTGNLSARLDAGAFNLRKEVELLERTALVEALRRSDGNAAAAARLLGEVGRGSAGDPGSTVRAMMRRLRVGRP
jgi:transcriptional regulator with PAS, ATPase and Fis domain